MNPEGFDRRWREQDVSAALRGLGFGQHERLLGITGCLQLDPDVEGCPVEVAPAEPGDLAEAEAGERVEHEQGREAVVGEGIQDRVHGRNRRGDEALDVSGVTPGEGGGVVVDEPVALGVGEGTAKDRAGSSHGVG